MRARLAGLALAAVLTAVSGCGSSGGSHSSPVTTPTAPAPSSAASAQPSTSPITPPATGATTAPASLTTAVTVTQCPTTYGVTGQHLPRRYPATERLARTTAASFGLYSDATRHQQPVLAPRGWACQALDAADGSSGLDVYPPGGSPSSSREISVTADVTCQGCIAATVCHYLPSADSELGYPAAECPSRPADERSTVLRTSGTTSPVRDVIAVEDPRGENGRAATPTNTVLVYDWTSDSSGHTAADGLATMACTLPNAARADCTTLLNAFWRQGYEGIISEE